MNPMGPSNPSYILARHDRNGPQFGTVFSQSRLKRCMSIVDNWTLCTIMNEIRSDRLKMQIFNNIFLKFPQGILFDSLDRRCLLKKIHFLGISTSPPNQNLATGLTILGIPKSCCIPEFGGINRSSIFLA